jgi:ABC-2 type transport system permease protein
MSFLPGLIALVKKEVKIDFQGSMLYIFAAIFSFVNGAIFYNNLANIKEITNVTIVDLALLPTFQAMNFLLIIFIPMLTMTTFVQEKRNNTLVLLQLSRLTEVQIFLAKYVASIIKVVFILLPTLIYPIILSFSGFNDWPMIFTNYCGILGLSASYLVVGVFASLLTKNYIVSIVTSFGILFSFLILFSTGTTVDNEILGTLLRNLSLGQHIFYFSRGAIVSYDIVYFASFVSFFSYLGVSLLGVKK